MTSFPLNSTIAIANQNGGVGKTTTTMNLAASLSEAGKKTLVIDFDPQGTLTIAHGFDPDNLSPTIYEVLLGGTSIKNALIQMNNGVDLIPSNLDLAAAEVELLGELGREGYLKEALLPLREAYEFILIDCPPSLGLLTINALVASDAIIIPVPTHYLRLRGTKLLLGTIEKVRNKFNPNLIVPKILPTMYQSRTIHSREILEKLQNTFGEQVFNTIIKHTVRLAEAPSGGKSILYFSQNSPHAEAYRQLANEVNLWLKINQSKEEEEISSLSDKMIRQ